MSGYKKLAKNTFWFSIGNIGSKTITFLMVGFYSNYLTIDEYGALDLLTTVISLAIPILSIQISDAILRFVLEKGNNQKDTLTNALLITCIGIVVSICIFPIIKSIMFLSEDGRLLFKYVKYLFPILWLNMISNVFKFYLRAKDRVQLIALSDVLYTLLFVILNINFIAFMGKGIDGYFVSMTIGYSFMILMLFIKGKLYKEIGKVDKKLLLNMVIYSIPMIPNTLSWWVMNASDRFVVTSYLGLSAAGIYAVSYKLPTIITTLNSIIYSSWQVSAIEEYDSEDSSEFYTNIFKINFAVIMIVCSFILIFIKLIFKVWVSKDFYEAWIYSPYLIIGVGLSAFSSFFGVGYLVKKKTIGNFYTSVVGAIINLALNLILIKNLSLQAASISTMVAYLIMWIMRVLQTRKFLKVKMDYKNVILSTILLISQGTLTIYLHYAIVNIFSVSIFIIIFTMNYKFIKPFYIKIKNKVLKNY